MCGDFLVWGSALPVLLDIYLFSINLNINWHSLLQFLLHHIDWNLNTFKSLLRKRSPFHISFKIFEFAAFFMVVSSYIPSLKHELKSKEIKTFLFFLEGLDLASEHLKHFPENGFNSYDSILVFHLVFPFHIFLRISERDLTLVRLCERGRAGQSLHQEILHLSLGGFCYSHHHRRHRHHPHA